MRLPPVEIVAKQGLYDTAARMDAECRGLLRPCTPSSLSPTTRATPSAIRAEVERAALEVYRAYGLRDLGRLDVIWDGAQARVLETNVSPGMTEAVAVPCGLQGGRAHALWRPRPPGKPGTRARQRRPSCPFNGKATES